MLSIVTLDMWIPSKRQMKLFGSLKYRPQQRTLPGFRRKILEVSFTIIHFTTLKVKSFFTNGSIPNIFVEDIPSKVAGHKILWADPQGLSTGVVLAFDGIPFQVLGRKIFDCQHGTDRNKAMKACNAAQFKV